MGIYEETKFYGGCSIEEAMRILLREEERQGPTKGKFNKVWLYSDKDSIDSAYIKVTGMTQAEHIGKLEIENDEYKKQKEIHQQKIPELIEHYTELGHKMLETNKWAYWDEILPIRLNDIYQGMEVQNCLDIIMILEHGGTLEEAKKELNNQNHSGMSYSLVVRMVKDFSKKGDDFLSYIENH